MSRIKRSLLMVWNNTINLKIITENQINRLVDIVNQLYTKSPKVFPIEDTLLQIINNKLSVCRYGDGEFKLIKGLDITFQKADIILANKLKQILAINEKNLMVCIPDVFDSLHHYENQTRKYWQIHISKNRLQWYKLLRIDKQYGNSFISRFYNPFVNKKDISNYIVLLKKLWDDREVVIIEGAKSRLGIGNDLFNSCKSIERILVPEENAFEQYDKILFEASKLNKEKLILIAAGPTATILAYDLYKKGYQAIDIGHVDIEYEWYLRKAKTKIKIENKYVCEAGKGEGVGELNDQNYTREIISIVN
ncbi:SP_1767 family glycosyltransferase [Metabacillus sp. GX 13764]|uniref:SP_1767 family glycosyltransferase n=1 Tax=Metabacillus kandeliae TaxID=2900151 RepID=UPI001E632C82|nr:SP_1767 family glycosyltransferase [Metabacillus kandeliae]MCD7033154.1 SP_1767 family glycosyltransferase [Metabacillus kandeliae]